MKERIHQLVDQLFSEAPHTRKAAELKEEVSANLLEHYQDLLSRGLSEEEAFKTAAAGIGDVDELIRDLNRDYDQDNPEVRKRSALLVSTAVGLYILSVVPVILAETINIPPEIGVVFMFLFCAVATVLLVYNNMVKPRYHRADDTVVEEFKEWQRERGQKNQALSALSSALWTITVVVYLFISFTWGVWSSSWIVFLLAAAIQQIIRYIFALKNHK